ncbi:MAG: zinc-finger domain-containing protein [Proteobacteria bacterium]|nr:zinc-finger domain-containing protein [Pseudomonadota bacterium]
MRCNGGASVKETNQPIQTKDQVIRCDGGGLPLGHPTIFLNLGHEGKVVCPYCSKSFVKSKVLKTTHLKQTKE